MAQPHFDLCRRCTRPIPPGCDFCSNCGDAVLSEAAMSTSPAVLGRQLALAGEVRRGRKLVYWTCIPLAMFALWVLGFFMLAASKPAEVAPSPNASHGQVTPVLSKPGAGVEKALAPQQAAQPGQTVHIGYWSYKVNRAAWSQFLPGQSLLEHADAQYLIVDLTVRNDDRTPSHLPPIKIVDEEGRTSEPTADAHFQPGVFDFLKEINPDVESQGYAIFDVNPNHHYRVLLSGGYGSDGATALAELPIKTPSPSAPLPQQPSPVVPVMRWEGGIRYKRAGRDWIRMDMDDTCGSPMPDGGDYPQVCKLREY